MWKGRNQLPENFTHSAEIGHSKNFKPTIVRRHIKTHKFYDDADPPLTNTLLKMVIARAWVGNDGDEVHPALENALTGVSPFLAQPLSKFQIAAINAADDDLTNATHTLPTDHHKLRTKQKVDCPNDGLRLILLLKRFANLIYATFSDTCPLFHMTKTIIDAIKEYDDEDRMAMSPRSIAAIL